MLHFITNHIYNMLEILQDRFDVQLDFQSFLKKGLEKHYKSILKEQDLAAVADGPKLWNINLLFKVQSHH